MEFESVVGLEIHAQLLTQTKIFAGVPLRLAGLPIPTSVRSAWGFPARYLFSIGAPSSWACAPRSR